MKPINFCLAFTRQIAYASLCLGMILIFIERVIPGFSTPYLHPYFVFVFGFVCAIAASSSESPSHYSKKRSRIFIPVFLLLFLCFLIGGSFSRFEGAALALGIAFFVARLYSDEV